MDLPLNYMPTWYTSPGVYIETMVIPHLVWPKPDNVSFQTAFEASVHWSIPTCLRYSNPVLLKDGREISAVVEETGTPGEPGWVWRFYITEPVKGEVIWKVETKDCPKVS